MHHPRNVDPRPSSKWRAVPVSAMVAALSVLSSAVAHATEPDDAIVTPEYLEQHGLAHEWEETDAQTTVSAGAATRASLAARGLGHEWDRARYEEQLSPLDRAWPRMAHVAAQLGTSPPQIAATLRVEAYASSDLDQVMGRVPANHRGRTGHGGAGPARFTSEEVVWIAFGPTDAGARPFTAQDLRFPLRGPGRRVLADEMAYL